MPAEGLCVPLLQRRAIDADLTALGRPQTNQRTRQGRFARSAWPNYAQRAALLELEGHVLDHRGSAARWNNGDVFN